MITSGIGANLFAADLDRLQRTVSDGPPGFLSIRGQAEVERRLVPIRPPSLT